MDFIIGIIFCVLHRDCLRGAKIQCCPVAQYMGCGDGSVRVCGGSVYGMW